MGQKGVIKAPKKPQKAPSQTPVLDPPQDLSGSILRKIPSERALANSGGGVPFIRARASHARARHARTYVRARAHGDDYLAPQESDRQKPGSGDSSI